MPNRGPENVSFPEIWTQLRITNRLLAARLKANMKQVELIALLASTGASHQEIADVLDTTPGTVAVTLQRLKKRRESSKTAAEAGGEEA